MNKNTTERENDESFEEVGVSVAEDDEDIEFSAADAAYEATREAIRAVIGNHSLTLEEQSAEIKRLTRLYNETPVEGMLGLTPLMMQTWTNGEFGSYAGVSIKEPSDIRTCPMMRYLSVILEFAAQNDGCIELSEDGVMPFELLDAAEALYPEFAFAGYGNDCNTEDYTGAEEGGFTALDCCRLTAQLAEIIEDQDDMIVVSEEVLTRYKTQGVTAFYLPMLESSVSRFNWMCLDEMEGGSSIQQMWLFMTWRIAVHGSVDRMEKEMFSVFPEIHEALLDELTDTEEEPVGDQIEAIVALRFVIHFLIYWGFVTIDEEELFAMKGERKVTVLPAMKEVFEFGV